MKKNLTDYSLHPTDEELADFVDNRLEAKGREEILEHLIYCDDCTEIVAGVMRRQQECVEEETLEVVNDTTYISPKKPQVANQDYVQVKYANNWFYDVRVRAIVLSGLVASFVLFIVFKDGHIHIDDSNSYEIYKGSKRVDNNISIDSNKVISEIIKFTDVTYLEDFKKAEKIRTQWFSIDKEEIQEAEALYRKALNKIDENRELDVKERYNQESIIWYSIFKLRYEHNKTNAKTNSAREILRDKILDYTREIK